jgi:hypothetical protein
MLERYNDMTRSVAKAAEIPLIDLASTLVKSSRFYYVTIHAGRKNNGGFTYDNVQRVKSRGVLESVALRRCNPMAPAVPADNPQRLPQASEVHDLGSLRAPRLARRLQSPGESRVKLLAWISSPPGIRAAPDAALEARHG